jgi:hypothetical protein
LINNHDSNPRKKTLQVKWHAGTAMPNHSGHAFDGTPLAAKSIMPATQNVYICVLNQKENTTTKSAHQVLHLNR